MRKIFLSVMLLCGSSIGFAQLMEVGSTQKVNLPEGVKVDMATISPNGDYLLVADQQKQGLQKLDLATGQLTTVTTASGSEYDAKILDNGNTIVYRETQIGKDHLKRQALKSVNLQTGEVQTIVDATRELNGVAANGDAVYVVKGRKLKTKAMGNAKADKKTPVAFIEYGQLMLTSNGKTVTLSPNGTEGQSYLWPSVSPDGTKVLYYLAGQGAFTCNIDGTDVQHIGYIRAAKWYDNNIVVGMHDTDNGEFVTSSEVIAYSADGKEKQVLSDASTMAMYPTVSSNGEKISFTTPSGEAYIINVKTK